MACEPVIASIMSKYVGGSIAIRFIDAIGYIKIISFLQYVIAKKYPEIQDVIYILSLDISDISKDILSDMDYRVELNKYRLPDVYKDIISSIDKKYRDYELKNIDKMVRFITKFEHKINLDDHIYDILNIKNENGMYLKYNANIIRDIYKLAYEIIPSW
jgi:hypothetical protein